LFLYTGTVSGFWTASGRVCGHIAPSPQNGRILLANPLQSSSSTFSCGSCPSFFAFQAGMWDTQMSALLSLPTGSASCWRLHFASLLFVHSAIYINNRTVSQNRRTNQRLIFAKLVSL